MSLGSAVSVGGGGGGGGDWVSISAVPTTLLSVRVKSRATHNLRCAVSPLSDRLASPGQRSRVTAA